MPSLRDQLSPIQLEVGVQGGCEAAIHAICSVLDHPTLCEEWMVLKKMDIHNAFNSVCQDHILQVCAGRAVPLLHLANATYAKPSELILGNDVIMSKTGTQQSDPLGHYLFALSINDIAWSITSPINLWYLDDATIDGSPSCVNLSKNFLYYQELAFIQTSQNMKLSTLAATLLMMAPWTYNKSFHGSKSLKLKI